MTGGHWGSPSRPPAAAHGRGGWYDTTYHLVTSQVRELSYIHSRDVTYATFCQGPYEKSARYPALAEDGGADVTAVDVEIGRNGASKTQRIMLRTHTDDTLSIHDLRQDLHSQFDRIADDDKQRPWQPRGAFPGDPPEDWEVDHRQIASRRMLA